MLLMVAMAAPIGPGVHTTLKLLAVRLVGAAQLPLVSVTTDVEGRLLPVTVKVVATPDVAVSGLMPATVTLPVVAGVPGVVVSPVIVREDKAIR